MPNQIHHGGYPIGSVDYVPKSFKRRGAFIRYISAGSVIWLFKPDIDAHYAQLEARARTTQPPDSPPNGDQMSDQFPTRTETTIRVPTLASNSLIQSTGEHSLSQPKPKEVQI